MLRHTHRDYLRSILPIVTLLTLTPFPVLLPGQAAAQKAAQTPPSAPPTPTPEIQALLDAGLKVQREGKLDEAERQFTRALDQSRVSKDRVGEAVSLRRLGNAAIARREFSKAVDLYQQSAGIAHEIGDRRDEAFALTNIGVIYKDTGQLQKALEYHQQALPIYQDLKDKDAEARTLTDIGLIFWKIGQPQKALELFQQTLNISRALGNKDGEANAFTNIGLIYSETDQPQKALEYYQQALPIYQAVGDKIGEASVLNNTGVIYRNTGQPQKALEYHHQALKIFRALGDKKTEALALNNIGRIFNSIGQPQEALKYHQQALLLYRALGDKGGEATTCNYIGIIYSETGQPQKALEYYQQALPVFRDRGDKKAEAATLNNIGGVYAETGQPQKALESLQQALPISHALDDKGGEANALTNIGGMYARMDQPQKGLEYQQQALLMFRTLGDKGGEGSVLNYIGRLYHQMGQPQKGLEYQQQALHISRMVGDINGEASALYNIGLIYHQTGQLQKALELYQQALHIYQTVGDKYREALALNYIGAVEKRLGRLDATETHYRQAVAIQERLRTELGGYTESKAAFLSANLGDYYRYLRVLLGRNKAETAFAVVQQTKARSLLDLLESGRVDLTGSLNEQERKDLDDLRGQASFLNAQMVKQGVENAVGAKGRFAAYARQLKQVESKLQTLTDTLYARHPDLAHKRAATTTTLADLAQFLPGDTALLDYVVVSPDEVRLFVVTVRHGKATLHAYPIHVKYALLEKQANAFHAACANPTKPYQPEATALYRLLIAPAEKDLLGRKRLLICPDQTLWNIPFAALMPGPPASPRHVGSRPLFLADRFEIAYAYSATGAQAALQSPKRPVPSGSILVVANPAFGDTTRFGGVDNLPGQRPFDLPSRPFDLPSRPFDFPSRPFELPSRQTEAPSRAMAATLARGNTIAALPGTKQEADAILGLFPNARLLIGEEAQESTVKAQAGCYRYLHFATHGFLNDAAPLLSSIVLAKPEPGSKEDGFLTVREVFDLKLNADLVVLSSCNSGRGQIRTGEGIVGLTWAFFAAGVSTQVVSQWSVDDAATAQLMTAFYRSLKAGRSKGAALQEASLFLRNDGDPTAKTQNPKYRHPYYWAPFTLVGDWR